MDFLQNTVMWSLCIISSVLGKGTDGEGKLINSGIVFGLNADSLSLKELQADFSAILAWNTIVQPGHIHDDWNEFLIVLIVL